MQRWLHGLNEEGASGLSDDDLAQGRVAMWQAIKAAQGTKVRPLWPRIAAAASIIIACSVGGYFILHQPKTEQVALLKPGTFKNDALPGNKAILTLGNGQQIVVSAAKNGMIAQQGSTSISKTANGGIVYAASNNDQTLTYNTYTVPRGGGKHSLVLADGTLAILDAASSIRYPTAFSGKDRKVEVTGQVYFEVVHNANKPFFVTAKGQTIEDIGTHFNVNAFDDEPGLKTTLLEGSIKIAGKLLRPGQQAVQVDGRLNILNNVNTQEVVAWKNDLFMFTNNTTLPIVMKQLGRWYDLEVIYQGSGKPYHFGGDMPRSSKLSDVLKILAYSGVQFSVDGKKIIVYQ
ncbi:FecR family protein [Mucilaginibacter sp.]|uniref:FecR family protein n=1 Tax=Mucilaginibacter sp. TaxID=1882438 RepID=UPI002616E77D|nr:FecR family protein [Mucilaginibacter sp.]